MNSTDTDALIERLNAVHDHELVYSNGILRTTKVIYAVNLSGRGKPVQYRVSHEIDGTTTCFTEQGIREVLSHTRSPWDGDIDPKAPASVMQL